MNFFSVTKPNDKYLFIQATKEVHCCLQLLVHPLGISDDVIGTFESIAKNENTLYQILSNQYKNWEETLSRRIYAKYGVSDENVAAAINQFIEIDKSDELMLTVKESDLSLQQLLFEQSVVELPSTDITTELEATILVEQVLTAIYYCFESLIIPSENIKQNKLINDLFFNNDSETFEKLSVYVMTREILPVEFNYQSIHSKCLSNQAIDKLVNALTINSNGIKTKFTPLQYFTLLRIHLQSSQLQATIDKVHKALSAELIKSINEHIDISDNEFSYNQICLPNHLLVCLPSIQPAVSYFTQLCGRLNRNDYDYDNAFDAAKRCLHQIACAKDANKNESIEKAIEHINIAIEDTDLLPIFLRVQLLVLRAEYLLEIDIEASLDDINLCLTLDSRNVEAYKLRGKYHSMTAQSDEAAFDCLASFVLGGSSDLSLAANAEEAISHAIRSTAKQTFYDKTKETNQVNNDDIDCDSYSKLSSCRYPKQWLVMSYFSGYELLSDAFTTLPLTLQSCLTTKESLSDIDIEGNENSEVPIHLLEDSIVQPLDSLAYITLRRIVEAFDSLNDNLSSPSAETTLDKIEVLNKVKIDIISKEEFSSYSSDANIALDLVDEGIFDILESEINSSSIDDNDDESTNLTCCLAYLSTLNSLRSREIEQLTGVGFNINGSVTSIDSVQVPSSISRKLRARLVNVCGSIAYLSGDSIGSLQCFRLSKELDEELLDSYVKLGALLVDMEDVEEASQLYATVKEIDPSHPYVYLHQAEATLSLNEYPLSLNILRQASRKARDAIISSLSFTKSDDLIKRSANSQSNKGLIEKVQKRRELAIDRLESNIYALEGIALFRLDPNNITMAIDKLEEGIHFHPNNPYLFLCIGELISQTGDMVKALDYFKKAHELEPYNPMPFINASRVYQQLSYKIQTDKHINKAILLDSTLTMTYVDISQIYLSNGQIDECLETLEKALKLARHVSEIKDVLTAQAVGKLTRQLEDLQLYIPPCKSF